MNKQHFYKKFSILSLLLIICGTLFSEHLLSQEIINNDSIRFGNGTEQSISASGNLQQPFYYSSVQSTWRKLTYSIYPLDNAFAIGGDGTNSWNLNGTITENPSMSSQVIDRTGFVGTTGNNGYGTIIATGDISVGGTALHVQNTYRLGQNDNYITITSKITNNSAGAVSNVRIWIGTRDDYVGGTDVPRKQRGNLVNDAFVANTNPADQALALLISTSSEGVLFFTKSEKGQNIVQSCCSWSNVINQNPATSSIDVTSDGSYGFYVRLSDLVVGASDEFTWYYAAASLTRLAEVIAEVSSAAASVRNITYTTAEYEAKVDHDGLTGHYVLVAGGSTAPTAPQIVAGINYGAVTVISHASRTMTANVAETFNLTGLTAGTSYDIYFVADDLVPTYTEIKKVSFVTEAYLNPVITSSLAPNAAENQTSVITVTATDANAMDTYTFAISGGADQTLFSIDANSGVLTFNSAPNFEIPGDANADNHYLVQVTVTDNSAMTLTDVETINVSVTNVNEAITITSLSSASVTENQTSAITVTASDIDAGDTKAFSITGGADQTLFSIGLSSGVLTFKLAPNFEIPGDVNTDNNYVVVVTVTDGGGLADIQTITISVNDINEAPVIVSASTANTAETQTDVITVSAADPDAGDTKAYSISGGADETFFSIEGVTGVLTFITAPDYEKPIDANADNDYIVDVTVTDALGLTDVQVITVSVTNIVEFSDNPPIITSDNFVSINENETDVITVTATDADLGDTQTYSISGGADGSLFSIDAATGILTLVSAPDYENPTDANKDNDYIVEVTVTDLGGATDLQSITVTVVNVNENPVITSSATVNAAENQTGVITVIVSFDAGDTYNFSISGGTDQALFSIDATTGVLTFISAPDFEIPTDVNTDNDYIVQITVTDGGGLTDVQTITVSVTNIAEFTDNPPVINSSDVVSVDENQTAVITLTATDADAGDTQTYSITGGADPALFSIDAATGVLTFLLAPDFEIPTDANADNDYVVEVTVTDGGGLTDIQTITVSVINVAEFSDNPPVISSSDAVSVNENQTAVITVTATDDAGDTQAYSITGGTDLALFSIDATGVLIFISAPDFEIPTDANTDNNYVVEVTVTDGAGLTDVQSITVTVNDVSESIETTGPTVIEGSNIITPNGDGKNDIWVIQNISELTEYELYIFNNIGEKIYYTKSYDNTWDATYNGKIVSNGTYYYMFVNGKIVFKGAITVVK
jgi:gliding motility-associated-like protein